MVYHYGIEIMWYGNLSANLVYWTNDGIIFINSLIIQIHETCILTTIIGWRHAHKYKYKFTKNEGIPIMELLSQSRCGVHDGETDSEFVLGHPFWVTAYTIGGPDLRSKRHVSFIDFMILWLKNPRKPLLATWHTVILNHSIEVCHICSKHLGWTGHIIGIPWDNRVDNHTFHM